MGATCSKEYATPTSGSEGWFLFSYFRRQSETLHYALSTDGRQWYPLNNNQPVLYSQLSTKSIRDPFVMRLDDGSGYVLLHSDSWKSKLFHRWFSSDLLSWSNETMVDAMPSSYDTALVWAPKAVFDEQTGDYVVLWCAADNSDLDRKRIWSCRTKDFVTWGPAAVLLDPGYTVIDGQIVRTSERFYLFFKDERITEKSIRIAMSDLIDSGYSNISDTITPYLTEGPFAIDMGKFWFLYCDNYPPWGHYDALQCDDLDQVAQQPGSASKLFHEFSQSDVDFPPDCRHGSVIPVTLQQADALLKKYPSPVPSPALQQHAPQLCSQITLSRRTVGAVFQAERRYAEPVPLQLDAKSSHVNM